MYDVSKMKCYLKSLDTTKKRRELCVAGIEMFLLNEEDISYIASNETSEQDASMFLHRKIMTAL